MANLNIENTPRNPVKTITAAAYTLLQNDDMVLGDATAGAIIITLLPAAACIGLIYCFKKIDAGGNSVTIDGAGSETIDGATTAVLATQFDTIVIESNGTAWFSRSSNIAP